MSIEDLEKRLKELREEEKEDPVKFLEGCKTIVLSDINEERNIIKIEYSAVWIKIIGIWNDFFSEKSEIKIPNMGDINHLIKNVKRGIVLMYELNKQFI